MAWPETFGDTTAEYVAAHDGAGFVGERMALFWAVGADAVSFLQGIVSQDVEGLQPAGVARSLLLEPRGKLQSVLWLLRDAGRVGLLTDAALLEPTMGALSRWRIRVDVEFQVDERPMFEVWGPGDAGLSTPGGQWADDGGVLVAELAARPIRRRVVAGLDEAALRERGMLPIGTTVATTLRIEIGEPLMGVDVDEKTIPQESGLVAEAVSFTKGCYLGQELVARIDSRGHVNRHLRAMRLHDPVIPPVGAEVRRDGSSVGAVTSVGESLAVRAPVAMGLVRREVQPGDEVEVAWDGGSAKATVEAFPLL